jgi:hypothetical protein
VTAHRSLLPHNPVKDLGRINGRPKTVPRALTLPRLRQLRTALTYDDKATARDLPDLVASLVATGAHRRSLRPHLQRRRPRHRAGRGPRRRRASARRRVGDQVDQDRRRPTHPGPPALVHGHAARSSAPAAGEGRRQRDSTGVSRTARPRQHLHDQRRLLRPKDRSHRRRRRPRSTRRHGELLTSKGVTQTTPRTDGPQRSGSTDVGAVPGVAQLQAVRRRLCRHGQRVASGARSVAHPPLWRQSGLSEARPRDSLTTGDVRGRVSSPVPAWARLEWTADGRCRSAGRG